MPAIEKRSKPAKFALRMTATLGKEAKQKAAKEGVSLNQFINLAVAEKVEYLENEEWIAKRRPPSKDRIRSAIALLARKGGQPPAAGDEIPNVYKVGEREPMRKTRRKAS